MTLMSDKSAGNGYFGPYGGQFVPETLMPALAQLDREYRSAMADPAFHAQFADALRKIAGRPSELYFASRFTEMLGGAKIYLKREDMNHTGAHKINNTIGQALLAQRMGKKRVIAETGAGQHGVASATAACVFGLKCVVYMGAVDIERQALNVYKMKLLGAEVRPVTSGSQTLKDATNVAIRDWVTNVEDTHYLIGSVVGPHPYPMMVRDFQSVIGRETRASFLKNHGGLPDYLLACVGGGSNSMGFFYPFLKDKKVRMIGVEAGGEGVSTKHHASSITAGRPGILHGMKSYLLQDKNGQVQLAHSISAGLDYPSVGPEHSHLSDSGRVQYVSVTDTEALKGFDLLTKLEGIMPALESAHVVGHLSKLMPKIKKTDRMVICLSGRGDKDIHTVQQYF